MDFYKDLSLTPLPNNRLEVNRDYKIKVGEHSYTIPKDYTTNGADIPRPFWCVYPPNKTDYLPAVILHDYLCSQANNFYEQTKSREVWLNRRTRADKVFYTALLELGISKLTAKVFYYGVTLGKWISYGWR